MFESLFNCLCLSRVGGVTGIHPKSNRFDRGGFSGRGVVVPRSVRYGGYVAIYHRNVIIQNRF